MAVVLIKNLLVSDLEPADARAIENSHTIRNYVADHVVTKVLDRALRGVL